MPAPSAAAERLAAHWVADALAADEGIDFSVIKTLVGVSSEYLVGAPEAARERVALRCLQELAAFAVVDEGGAAAAAAVAPSGMLRVDASRSCEDLLVELTGQVGSSKSFEKDKILPFRQDIQNFISIKKPALPEFSLELLREVDPEIQSVGASSPGDQSGIKKHDNDQSLCSVNHPHSNVEKPRLPKVSPELQPENSTNVVNETEIGNFQQCPIEPTVDLDQPCASESRFYDQQQEDAINAASVGARSPEKNLSDVDSDVPVAAVPASVSCNVTLQGNIVEPLSKKDKADKTTMDQSTGKSSNPNDDGISDQSLKDRSHESQTVQATPAPPFDRSNDVLPTNTTEASHLPEVITTEDTTMVHQPNSFKTHLSYLQHDTGQKVSQDLDGSAGIPPVEKDPIHDVRAPSAIPSVTCNGAMQEDKSGTNHPSGSTTEHTATLEEQNGDKSQLEVSCADKNNHILCDDGTMLERNKVCIGLNVHTAPESHSCNVTLHDKISESNSLSEQNIGKNTHAIPKRSCSISVPNSSQDGDRKRAKQDSNKQSGGETVAETSHVQTAAHLLSMTGKMPFCSQDQEANDSLGVSQEQDLCIKCGKDGQLLQCSSCLLSAHDSCFGSSVTIEDSEQFYCPVCICTKATEAYQKAKRTYIEARKNLAAFLGTEQLLKQHDDQQQTGVLPRSANSEAQLNGQNLSNRQDNSNQTNTDDLAHEGEESDRQKKKQKINVTSDAYKEAVIEKACSVRNSDMAAMNKHSVLQNDSNQPLDAEKDHHVENTEAREDADNCYSPHGRRDSCQNRCSPANPEAEADKVDGPSNSRESEDSDEIEATSSDNSGKRSSPPWRLIKHHKARPQERETTLSSNSRKAFGQQDQHMPSPSRKRNYAYPPKRYSNPVVPTGRRSKLCWTEEEEAALREAMEKFTPRDDGPIPWIQILEHGRNVFHKTRLPCDLRVKWRNMKKKAGS